MRTTNASHSANRANYTGGSVFQRITLVGTALTILSSLGGCASLRGQPDGLTKTDFEAFKATTLAKNLEVAQTLAERWRGDRKEAYDWVFWSNASLIPLAAGGAGAALFKGGKDLITGIGLAAGTVIGTNSFIGAADLGAAYQGGIIGLSCVYSKLSPYTDPAKIAAGGALITDANALTTLIATANQKLVASTNLDLTSKEATAERIANPSIIAVLSNNEKVLTQTITNAQAAVTGALSEGHLFATLPTYARDRIIDVDNIVGMRIKPKTVNFAALSASLSTPAPAPTPQTPVSGVAQPPPAPGAHAAVATPPPTPIAQAAKDTQDQVNILTKTTLALVKSTSDFDLSTQENNVATCLKNL